MHPSTNNTITFQKNESEHCILAILNPKKFLFTDPSSLRLHVLNSQLAADKNLSYAC